MKSCERCDKLFSTWVQAELCYNCQQEIYEDALGEGHVGRVNSLNTRPSLPLIIFKDYEFVLTGRLENFTRNQAIHLIEERGGQVSPRIHWRTTYCLIKGKNPGSKYSRALEYGIRIVGEMEFAAAVLVNTPEFQPRKNIVTPVSGIKSAPEGKRRFKL